MKKKKIITPMAAKRQLTNDRYCCCFHLMSSPIEVVRLNMNVVAPV